MTQLYRRYLNRVLFKTSIHNMMRWERTSLVPGWVGDPFDRNQPGRFDKWYKLPKAAHKLFWRVRNLPQKENRYIINV